MSRFYMWLSEHGIGIRSRIWSSWVLGELNLRLKSSITKIKTLLNIATPIGERDSPSAVQNNPVLSLEFFGVIVINFFKTGTKLWDFICAVQRFPFIPSYQYKQA